MNVLIVEDDNLVAEMLCHVLKMWGHAVALAGSGSAAVDQAGGARFDLAMVDILLPDGFGYDFLPQIKRFQPDLKIITMTGHNTPEMERRIRKEGIAYYMAKPVNIKELRDVVEHIARKSNN